MKLLISLLLFASALHGYDPRLTNVTQIATSAQRVDACHVGCTTGQELIFDSASGSACPNGGTAYQLWSMTYDGSNKINLTATHPVLAALTTLNEGNVKFNNDGTFVVFEVQGSTSTIACNNNAANPGAGFDSNAYVCDFPNFTACPQITHLTIGLGLGVLHPTIKGGQLGYMFWMNITGPSGGVDAGLTGTFRYATFAVSGGTPTIGTPVDCSDAGPCSVSPNWFEPAFYNPKDSATAFFTSNPGATSQVYAFDMSSGKTLGAVTAAASYSEFNTCDSTASWALVMGTQFTPNPTPVASHPNTDLFLSGCQSGVPAVPLTFYNTPGNTEYIASTAQGQVVISHPVWGNGQQYILWTLQDSSGGVVKASTIWRATYAPASTLLSGVTSTSGKVKQQ